MPRKPKNPPPPPMDDDDQDDEVGSLEIERGPLPGEIYDDQADDEAEPPPQVQAAPIRPAPPAPGGAQTPAYLAELLAKPGIGPDVMRGVNPATAWVQINDSGGNSDLMPLAFLAPEALDTLADKGFSGHTTFEVRTGKTGAVLCYFATVLDDLEPEEVPPGADPEAQAEAGGALAMPPQLFGLLNKLTTEIAALKMQQQMQAQQQQADPLAGVEKSLALLERVAGIAGRMFGAVPQQAPQSDLGAVLDVAAKVLPMLHNGADAGGAPGAPEGGAA